ncbi:MAG: HAD family hydrolase [Bacteroidetes bacterium]|nr:HAD family hydrolase [Bacteroidota bacterium]
MHIDWPARIDTIIWDWNGTLLDDVSICILSINELLARRKLKTLTHGTYREVFTFPVRSYYEAVGFNFDIEPFDVIALDFIRLYDEKLNGVLLFPEVVETLSSFQQHGYEQFMVSAMQHDFLKQTVAQLGISDYFQAISGIQDHFADGKIDMARHFLAKQNTDQDSTCLIGDTLHDYEVAEALGIQCILVAHGHQSIERLKKAGCPVVESLKELWTLFRINGYQT